jgi:hypothetical protein
MTLRDARPYCTTLAIGLLLFTLALAIAPTSTSGSAAAPRQARVPASVAVTPAAPAIEFVDNLGGTIHTAAISGTMAYIGQGSTLAIVDMSNPATPIRRSILPLLSPFIAVAGNLVYVGSPTELHIIDVTHAAAPMIVGQYTVSDHRSWLSSLSVANGRAYLVLSHVAGPPNEQLQILDVHDPTHVTLLGTYAGNINAIQVVGNLAYTLDLNNGLAILDVSDPAYLTVRGTFAETNQNRLYQGIAVAGSRIYLDVTVVSLDTSYKEKLVTLDVSDPVHPQPLGNLDIGLYYLRSAYGNLVFISSIDSNYNGALQILDASDPAHIVQRGTYPLSVWQVQVSGALAYLTLSPAPGGIEVLDISNLDQPNLRGGYHPLLKPTPLLEQGSIQVSGNLAYVAGNGLQLLDLTNPISPTLRGTYGAEFDDVYVAGGYAYFQIYSLQILDVSNPAAPVLKGIATPTGQVTAIAVADHFAYVVGRYCRYKYCMDNVPFLNIFDMSDPAQPKLLSNIDLQEAGKSEALALVGSFAYVGLGDTLKIVDVSNPAKPAVRLNTHALSGDSAIKIVGNLAYIAGATGLVILDVSNPASPVLRGKYLVPDDESGGGTDVQVRGNLAYVSRAQHVDIFDISKSAAPMLQARYYNVGGRIEVVGDLIYVAAGGRGLHILRVHPERLPALVARGWLPLVRQ